MLNGLRICSICITLWLSGMALPAFAALEESDVSPGERLKNDQEAVSGRYARFERLLSQMADMLGREDPERAELLRRAVSKGREQAIASELDEIARKLGEGDFGAAREKQTAVADSLKVLLKLLQSEDRRSSVEKERERLNNLLKNVRNTISEQRAARGSALNADAPSSAAPAQQKALNRTDGIIRDIKEHDRAQAEGDSNESGAPDSKGSSGQESGDEKGKPSEEADPKQNSDSDSQKTPSDAEAGDGKPDGKPSEKGDESGKSPESSPQSPSDQAQEKNSSESGGQSSQSQQGSPSESPSQQEDDTEQTPGRENIEAAKNLMQEALKQLKKQQREQAVDQQDAALSQLQKAARELEEMLKQLREEEKEMILATLEARFQRLLALQIQINEGTVDLAATPREEWLDNAVSQCRDLSQQQADLTRECSQTTALIREDGTSVSILVSMEDIESDMGSVSELLRDTKTGALTQSIQQDIKEALEELIKATQAEMEEMKSEQRQQQQQQANNQKKPPLVELMAEIRVLRSLQLRVNRRTKTVNNLMGEADPAEMQRLGDQLTELSERQMRLRESAAELAKQMEKRR